MNVLTEPIGRTTPQAGYCSNAFEFSNSGFISKRSLSQYIKPYVKPRLLIKTLKTKRFVEEMKEIEFSGFEWI